MLTTGTTPPITVGELDIRPSAASSSSFSGMSEAPKSTVFDLICFETRTRADRLVVHLDAGGLVEGIGPLRVDRAGKVAPAPVTSGPEAMETATIRVKERRTATESWNSCRVPFDIVAKPAPGRDRLHAGSV